MTSAQIDKIISHKYSNRKLATSGACARFNAKLKSENAADLKARITGDGTVQAQIQQMNVALNAFVTAIGMSSGGTTGGNVIEVTEYTEGDCPVRLWLGRIGAPNGDLTDENKAAANTARGNFADAAGKIRARVSKIAAVIGMLNDLGNSPQSPNVGGQVGDGSHDHTAAATHATS